MRLLRSVLREACRGLAALGWFWIGPPPHHAPHRPPAPALAPPPRGHPERVRPDLPLTDVELALQRQLLEPTREPR